MGQVKQMSIDVNIERTEAKAAGVVVVASSSGKQETIKMVSEPVQQSLTSSAKPLPNIITGDILRYHRIYKIEDTKVTADEFISRIGLEIYKSRTNTSFLEVVDSLILTKDPNDDTFNNMLTINGIKFYSYTEEYPAVTIEDIELAAADIPKIRSYKVTFQYRPTPVLKGVYRSKRWADGEYLASATSYREAKDKVRTIYANKGIDIKNLECSVAVMTFIDELEDIPDGEAYEGSEEKFIHE
jgi:hypothetical protein